MGLLDFGHGGCDNEIMESDALTQQSIVDLKTGYLACVQCNRRTDLGSDGLDGLEQNAWLSCAADRLAQKMSICGMVFLK
jgi:hypothetical protein